MRGWHFDLAANDHGAKHVENDAEATRSQLADE